MIGCSYNTGEIVVYLFICVFMSPAGCWKLSLTETCLNAVLCEAKKTKCSLLVFGDCLQDGALKKKKDVSAWGRNA